MGNVLFPKISAPKNPQGLMPSDPNPIKADLTGYNNTVLDSQRAAVTAGGTIYGNPEDNRRKIGTDPTQPRKSILGG